MKGLEEGVRSIEMDGLVWGLSKVSPGTESNLAGLPELTALGIIYSSSLSASVSTSSRSTWSLRTTRSLSTSCKSRSRNLRTSSRYADLLYGSPIYQNHADPFVDSATVQRHCCHGQDLRGDLVAVGRIVLACSHCASDVYIRRLAVFTKAGRLLHVPHHVDVHTGRFFDISKTEN